MKEVKQNEKNVKVGIVAANNHYGGYGPGTVNLFRENMKMDPLSFEGVDLQKIKRQIASEGIFSMDYRPNKKGRQTSLTDFG